MGERKWGRKEAKIRVIRLKGVSSGVPCHITEERTEDILERGLDTVIILSILEKLKSNNIE